MTTECLTCEIKSLIMYKTNGRVIVLIEIEYWCERTSKFTLKLIYMKTNRRYSQKFYLEPVPFSLTSKGERILEIDLYSQNFVRPEGFKPLKSCSSPP